ncbi:MAG: BMP family ABC transporter substrate-binding protein, partial [Pseudomonadota bacterium]
DAGKWAVGQASDMTKFAPKSHLTAIVDNWDKYYVSRVKAAMEGTWTSEDTWTGLKEGMVEMTAFNEAIPDEVKKEAKAAHDAIIAGTLHPFQGPFNKQDGSVAAKEGETLDDKTLLGMNWYVEGVEGQLPK